MPTPDVLSTVGPLVERPTPFAARAVLGMPVYNSEKFLEKTVEAVLAQTNKDFALVVLDDCSADASPEILKRVLADVPNAFVYRGRERRGMIKAWQDVFYLSLQVVPDQRYFAWCADHDLMDPRWLDALVDQLDQNPQATLAYPLTAPMDEEGRVLKRANQVDKYEARGFPDTHARFHDLHRAGKGFGNMIYGLIRSDVLEKAGVFRRVLAPDRLTVLEVGLRGEIHVVPEVLRWRRATAKYSKARQLEILFTPGERPPFNTSLNTRLSHAIEIYRSAAHDRPADLSFGKFLALTVDQVAWEVRKRTAKRFLTIHKTWHGRFKKIYGWYEPFYLSIKRNLFQVTYKKLYALYEPHYMRFKRSDRGKAKNPRPQKSRSA